MFNNTQHFYLVEYEKALEYGLRGNMELCIDICLQLRAKSDLGLFTRAMVNITLCDMSPIQERPHKTEFAREALRLAQELRSLPEDQLSSYAIQQYGDLEMRAKDSLEEAEKQEAQYEESLRRVNRAAEQARKEKGKERANMGDIEGGLTKMDLDEDSEYIEIDIPRTDNRPIVPWEIEGKFSVHVASPGAHADIPAAAELETIFEEDVVMSDNGHSPPLSRATGSKDGNGNTRNLQLPTPASSQPKPDH